ERPDRAIEGFGLHHHGFADPARARPVCVRPRLLRADDEHFRGLRPARDRGTADPGRQHPHPAHDRAPKLMSTAFLVAISAGVTRRGVVGALFIAIDQTKPVAATNGAWHVPQTQTTWLKQLEAVSRPLTARLPAHTTGPLRQKLSRAGDPGGLTPAGFHAVRYALAALFAIIGLTIGVLLHLPVPSLVVAPAAGAIAALLGYMTPSLWLQQRLSPRRRPVERALGAATALRTPGV